MRSAVYLAAMVSMGACSGSSQQGRVNVPPPDQTPVLGGNADAYGWEAHLPAKGSLVLIDRQTKSTFNLRGEAIAGPLAAEKRLLRQVPGVNMFWFAWSVFYPGSEVWGREQRVRVAELPTDKTGRPACGGGADCIPSLPNAGPPAGDLVWAEPDALDAEYLAEEDLVLGLFVDGVARAYPHNILWWHEIANDHVGAKRFSVTFCPLTGSGVAFAAGSAGYTFGVSGQLFDSNLVMYDHQSKALWPQLWMGAVSGETANGGTWLAQLPLSEMTWKRWRALHPDTLVLSSDTGFGSSYGRYPYGDYRTDHDDTFRTTDPSPDPMFRNKEMVFGLIDRASTAAKAYVHAELAQHGERAVINDSFNGRPVVVVYEQASRLVVAFESSPSDASGEPLSFDLAAF